MSLKTTTALAAKEAEKQRKVRESREKLGREAVVESAKIRERFAAERQALARRYGVVSGLE